MVTWTSPAGWAGDPFNLADPQPTLKFSYTNVGYTLKCNGIELMYKTILPNKWKLSANASYQKTKSSEEGTIKASPELLANAYLFGKLTDKLFFTFSNCTLTFILTLSII